MSVKIICSWRTLFKLASEEGEARMNGTKEELEEAIRQHKAYKDLCLRADEIRFDFDMEN